MVIENDYASRVVDAGMAEDDVTFDLGLQATDEELAAVKELLREMSAKAIDKSDLEDYG